MKHDFGKEVLRVTRQQDHARTERYLVKRRFYPLLLT